MDKHYISFLRDAYANGLCDEYKGELKRCHEDKLRLVTLAMRQQSIPYVATKINEGVLAREYVQSFKEYANGYVLNNCDGVNGYTYAMYVENTTPNTTQCDVTHFIWCDMDYDVALTKCQTLYLSNSSHITLQCKGYNNMIVYMFDDSVLNIVGSLDTCHIIVYQYSDACIVNRMWDDAQDDHIKVFRKKLKL